MNIFLRRKKSRNHSFTKRISELNEEYDCGIFAPPLSDRESMMFLTDYLLGEDWYSMCPISQEQINTEIVHEILYKYSRRYRKEYLVWKKSVIDRRK